MKYTTAKKIMDTRREMQRLTTKAILWGVFWFSTGSAWAGVTLSTHELTLRLGAGPDARVVITALASFAVAAGTIAMIRDYRKIVRYLSH